VIRSRFNENRAGLDEVIAGEPAFTPWVTVTHGTSDHTFSVVPVARPRGIPDESTRRRVFSWDQ